MVILGPDGGRSDAELGRAAEIEACDVDAWELSGTGIGSGIVLEYLRGRTASSVCGWSSAEAAAMAGTIASVPSLASSATGTWRGGCGMLATPGMIGAFGLAFMTSATAAATAAAASTGAAGSFASSTMAMSRRSIAGSSAVAGSG